MSTLLFTGGTGYIGSHTAVEFLDAGYDIVILDNLSNSSRDILDRIEQISGRRPIFYEGDIRDRAILTTIFSEHQIDTVIHFAGLKAVGESCDNPGLYHDNNIVGSIVLFDVMQQHNIRNIVFSSSATVYAENNPLPLTEEGELSTKNPYGTTKLVIENILRDYSTKKGWHIVCLRYFNPIGAHPSGLIGENPSGIPNNLLPYIMQVVEGRQSSIRVYGNDYDTPDGTGVRDYIHVVDLARGHLRAYDYIASQGGSSFFEAINLGTGKGTSVMEIIHITSNLLGREIPYMLLERRPGDMATVYCNPQKAEKMLGWTAEYDVERAIQDSLNSSLK